MCAYVNRAVDLKHASVRINSDVGPPCSSTPRGDKNVAVTEERTLELMQLGFDKSAIVAALEESGGDVVLAGSLLCGQYLG